MTTSKRRDHCFMHLQSIMQSINCASANSRHRSFNIQFCNDMYFWLPKAPLCSCSPCQATHWHRWYSHHLQFRPLSPAKRVPWSQWACIKPICVLHRMYHAQHSTSHAVQVLPHLFCVSQISTDQFIPVQPPFHQFLQMQHPKNCPFC